MDETGLARDGRFFPERRRRGRRGRAAGRTIAVGVVAAGLLGVLTPGTASAATGSVTITGAGFGHGVGMSQYGALGMAREGRTAGEILTHFYTGTTVGPRTDAVPLRVNVVDRGTRLALGGTALASGGGALALITSGGTTIRVPAGGSAVITPVGGKLQVVTTPAGGRASTVTTATLTVRWSGASAFAGPATVLDVGSRSANATSATNKTRHYRWGQLVITPVARTDSDGAVRGRLEAVAVLDLHAEYLRGVSEMPSSWPAAALQAQVVAARNYALAAYQRGTTSACGGCHLYDDSRSQVYSGWAKEAERVGSTDYGARWVAAVTATQSSATEALVVTYGGAVATTYFSSSSGGRTRASASTWGGTVAYLRGVADPWSVDPAVNPSYARWTRTVSLATVARVFGVSDVARLTVTQQDDSGAALTVSARSATGQVRSVSGTTFASRLGLPAQWLTAFSLPGSSAGTAAPGSAVTCAGALPRPTIGAGSGLCAARA